MYVKLIFVMMGRSEMSFIILKWVCRKMEEMKIVKSGVDVCMIWWNGMVMSWRLMLLIVMLMVYSIEKVLRMMFFFCVSFVGVFMVG